MDAIIAIVMKYASHSGLARFVFSDSDPSNADISPLARIADNPYYSVLPRKNEKGGKGRERCAGF
jgi:hypothetical protein